MDMDDDNPQPKQLTEAQAWVDAICTACGWDYRLMAGRAAKLGKQLRTAGGACADVAEHYGQVDMGAAWWWYRDHWLGKKGERPNDRWIRETWGAWELPIAVSAPASKYAGLMAYVQELKEQG